MGKKTWIKLVSLILVVALVMPIFSACNDQSEGEEQISITFETNGGDAIGVRKYAVGTLSDLLPKANKENSIFVGWCTDSALSTEVGAVLDKSQTVYAKWESATDSFTVLFDPNGGNIENMSVVRAAGGKVLATEFPTASWNGRDFLGWYSDANLTQKIESDITVTSNMRLYAKWHTIYKTVTYDLNDGKEDSTFTNQFIQYDPVPRPAAPTDRRKEVSEFDRITKQYGFLGWSTTKVSDDPSEFTPYTFTGAETDNVTLYAVWSGATNYRYLSVEDIDGTVVFEKYKAYSDSGDGDLTVSYEELETAAPMIGIPEFDELVSKSDPSVSIVLDEDNPIVFDETSSNDNVVLIKYKENPTFANKYSNYDFRYDVATQGYLVSINKTLGILRHATYDSATKISGIEWKDAAVEASFPDRFVLPYSYKGALVTGVNATVTPDEMHIFYASEIYGAFAGLPSSTLVVPASYRTIGDNGFAYSKLQNFIRLNEVSGQDETDGLKNITSIGKRAFAYCLDLEEISMDGVSGIGKGVFVGCSSLEVVNVGKFAKFTYNWALAENFTDAILGDGAALPIYWLNDILGTSPNLRQVNVHAENPHYKSVNGIVYNKAGTALYLVPSNYGASTLTIPKEVTSFQPLTFFRIQNLTRVQFEAGSNFNYIFLRSFYECNYNFTLDLSNTKLVNIDGIRVDYYGTSSVVQRCDVNILLPNTTKVIGDGAFAENNGSIVIPSSVTEIKKFALSGSNTEDYGFSSVTFEPNSQLKTIGEQAFWFVSATTMELPASLESIGTYCFAASLLTSITINSSIEISDAAFTYSVNLRDVFLGEGVTISKIGINAFEYCESLNDASLDRLIKDATVISEGAFARCAKITTINWPAQIPVIEARVFLGCRGLVNLNMPEGLLGIGVEPDFDYSGLGGSYTFAYCSSLATLNFPSTLSAISPNSFAETAVVSVVVPSRVKRFGSVFARCTKLVSLDLNTVESLLYGVTAGCTSLKTLTIPSTVTTIENLAFTSSSVEYMIIPASVQYIGIGLFFESRGLKAVFFLGAPAIPIGFENYNYWAMDQEFGDFYVLDNYEQQYKSAVGWSLFVDGIESFFGVVSKMNLLGASSSDGDAAIQARIDAIIAG